MGQAAEAVSGNIRLRQGTRLPYGYSYEMGINENVIVQIEDYIVQIEIPITEKE